MRNLLTYLLLCIALIPFIPAFGASNSPQPTLNGKSGNTYMAATALFTPPSSGYDIVTIAGSATRTIKILRIEFSMLQSTAGNIPIYLTLRSTANVGGTATAATAVPMDSLNVAGTAVVNAYTVVPTSYGTSVGNLKIAQVLVPAAATTATANSVLFDATMAGQPIVLRGIGQVLAINLNGTTPSGAADATATIWYEEVNPFQ